VTVRAAVPSRRAAVAPGRSATAGADLVLPFGEVFDLRSVRQVLAATLRATASSVSVDVSRTREIHDAAVAALARVAMRSPVPVSVRGLREHHRRLLQYLGLDAAEIFGAQP
jgi:hypothetical protein